MHLKVVVEKHPKLRKNGPNIESTEWLTISQAALGTKKTVSTLWGDKQVAIDAGTQDGDKITLRGEVHSCIFRASESQ